jgi:hypothetical protein
VLHNKKNLGGSSMFEFLIVLALIFAAYLMFFKDKSDAGQSSNEKEKDEAG